jgi:hypothetical protein
LGDPIGDTIMGALRSEPNGSAEPNFTTSLGVTQSAALIERTLAMLEASVLFGRSSVQAPAGQQKCGWRYEELSCRRPTGRGASKFRNVLRKKRKKRKKLDPLMRLIRLLAHANGPQTGAAEAASNHESEDLIELFHERAAIREFDGRRPRALAERAGDMAR